MCFNKKVEIFIDKLCYRPISEDAIRIIILQEPFYINNFKIYLNTKTYDEFYTFIFTYDKEKA